ncbi:LLM class flavin-dependent oxidoreductase [Rhodococcus oxybenzonivorans]|uniref:LLM class flavin-dependent oxidoreductase n=1 Tax=Rhodococcus oxybenzonivorans TaxID=1990687 RepID=A0A2S2BP04_9NOCA|nr:LLM class flavin-dependent oxidoreductase [Rhodococcus oxybenzonivorans]AWK70293.1 LLM class flavin-dependent oxidoreductase [Rhodococcus oxybenzonivorans]
MKLTYIQHLPYRHLPDDFADRHVESVVTNSFHELVDRDLMHTDLRGALDESMHAARAGFDAVGMTEHGSSSYDINPNPDLGAAALAYATEAEGLRVGIYTLGRSLGKSREPLRVAEELAWIDSISGGRLLAGFPVGLPYDANVNAGVPPIETRSRYDENLELILRAWTEREPFAWNGRYSQSMGVNIWPRPYQDPHPPVSITGIGNPATTRFALERDLGFNVVALGSDPKIAAAPIFDSMWSMAADMGIDANPYRAAMAVTVLVGETDQDAERLYAQHLEYSLSRGIGHIPMNRFALPGGISPQGLKALLAQPAPPANLPAPSYAEAVRSGLVVAGSPATVRETLADYARSFRIGQLMVFLQVGSMPIALTKHNIDLFASEVAPHLRPLWSEYDDDNRWWPVALGGQPASNKQADTTGARLK